MHIRFALEVRELDGRARREAPEVLRDVVGRAERLVELETLRDECPFELGERAAKEHRAERRVIHPPQRRDDEILRLAGARGAAEKELVRAAGQRALLHPLERHPRGGAALLRPMHGRGVHPVSSSTLSPTRAATSSAGTDRGGRPRVPRRATSVRPWAAQSAASRRWAVRREQPCSSARSVAVMRGGRGAEGRGRWTHQ